MQTCLCVEKSSATAKMSHMQLAGDVFVLEALCRFLHSYSVPSPSNVIFDGSWRPAFRTRVPAQNTQACVFRQQIAPGSVTCGGGLGALRRLSAGTRNAATSSPLTVMFLRRTDDWSHILLSVTPSLMLLPSLLKIFEKCLQDSVSTTGVEFVQTGKNT